MLIYAIILMVLMFAIGTPMLAMSFRSGKIFTTKALVALIVILAIGSTWMVGMNHMENAVIGDSTVMFQSDKLTTANNNVYKDNNTNSYFYISPNDWSLTKMFSRVYLDTEKTEQYINYSQAIDNIDLFGNNS